MRFVTTRPLHLFSETPVTVQPRRRAPDSGQPVVRRRPIPAIATATAARQSAKPLAARRLRYVAELAGVGIMMACFLAMAFFA